MSFSDFRYIITIAEYSETVTSGDVVQSFGTPQTVLAKVTQKDGTRFLNDEELVDIAIYEIVTWDLGWSNNIEIVYDSHYCYPVRPITRNLDPGSQMMLATIYVKTKR